MSDPNKTDENAEDPFDGLPEEEMPIIDGEDGLYGEDGEANIDGNAGLDGLDTVGEEEVVASREYEDAVADAKKIISSKKKSPRKKIILVLACVGAFLIGIIGWLGWSYWVDRNALETLNSDLMAARGRAESSKGNPEESGETAAANQLSSRIRQIVVAPWWDQVVVRIVDERQVVTAQEEARDLMESAKRRTENRAWWSEQVSSVDKTLAVEDRTIPVIQGALDDLQNAQAPHPNDGGFTDEMVAELGARLKTDSIKLTAMQDETLDQIKKQRETIESSATLKDLAAASEVLAKPLPTDRNPPELSEAITKSGQVAMAVVELLTARDAMQSELTSVLAEIHNANTETTLADSISKTLATLEAMTIPVDTRFDSVRELSAQCKQSASELEIVLKTRDESLAWITNRSTELADIQTLDEMVAFTTLIAEGDGPKSDLSIVIAALQDLAARIGARAEVLAEDQRLLEESIARAALCEQELSSILDSIKSGNLALAAEKLNQIQPETNDQIVDVESLKNDFSNLLVGRLTTMVEIASKADDWQGVANEFRACLSSPAILKLAPRFQIDSASVWMSTALGEDQMLYKNIQTNSHASYQELEPAARWYLNPDRTIGVKAPMHSQVSALLDSLAEPGVTVQIEGIEWSDTQCQWSDPMTTIAVVIGRTFHQFELNEVGENETSLLSDEQSIEGPHENQIDIQVNGQFSCSNYDGIFSGTGKLTVDDLRTGGRFSLPFWNHGDQSLSPHQLLLVSIPDDKVRSASDLPPWSDPR
jgi:hypothetical protein